MVEVLLRFTEAETEGRVLSVPLAKSHPELGSCSLDSLSLPSRLKTWLSLGDSGCGPKLGRSGNGEAGEPQCNSRARRRCRKKWQAVRRYG